MKYAWIENHRDEYTVSLLCRVLSVSRSGYCQWRVRTPSSRELANQLLDARVAVIHRDRRRSYGRLRITQQLRHQGECVSAERALAHGHRFARSRHKGTQPSGCLTCCTGKRGRVICRRCWRPPARRSIAAPLRSNAINLDAYRGFRPARRIGALGQAEQQRVYHPLRHALESNLAVAARPIPN